MHAKILQSCLKLCTTLWTAALQAPLSMDFSRSEWSGSCSLLQVIFATQGLNPGLPHGRQILYQLSHQGSPCYKHKGKGIMSGKYFKSWTLKKAEHQKIDAFELWC